MTHNSPENQDNSDKLNKLNKLNKYAKIDYFRKSLQQFSKYASCNNIDSIKKIGLIKIAELFPQPIT